MDTDLIAAVAVDGKLGLGRRPGRRQDKRRLVGLHHRVLAALLAPPCQKRLPGQIAPRLQIGRRAASGEDHHVGHGGLRIAQRVVGDRPEVDLAPLAPGDVGREQHPRAGQPHPLRQRSTAEAGEDDQMDGADTGDGQHGHDRLGDRRQVDGDAVAPRHAKATQGRGHGPHLRQQLGVGEDATPAPLVESDERGVPTPPRGDVPVERVVAEVGQAPGKPAKGRRLPDESLIPLPEPG